MNRISSSFGKTSTLVLNFLYYSSFTLAHIFPNSLTPVFCQCVYVVNRLQVHVQREAPVFYEFMDGVWICNKSRNISVMKSTAITSIGMLKNNWLELDFITGKRSGNILLFIFTHFPLGGLQEFWILLFYFQRKWRYCFLLPSTHLEHQWDGQHVDCRSFARDNSRLDFANCALLLSNVC